MRVIHYSLLFVVVSVFTGFIFISRYNDSCKKGVRNTKMPNDWFFRQRAFPYNTINHKAYVKALAQATTDKKALSSRESIWTFAGPVNIEGRITDIELLPGNSETIFIGTAQGGVFTSNDSGNNWSAVFDDVSSLSIGDIAVSPSNPDIIYVGTGEANAGGGSLTYDGTGVFKSTDGGNTWNYAGLEDCGSIGRMAVHPGNPDVAYVAAMGRLFAKSNRGGVYKTTDGGSTWQQVLFVSDSTGAIDLVLNPNNPDVVYAAMWQRVREPGRRSYGGATCGIYRSTDGGENWSELTVGLPSAAADKGRIGIDICQNNPDVLYAVYADSVGYFKGIYKTVNGGNSWIKNDNGIDDNAFVSYGWWFGRIKVDPTNPDIAFLIGFLPYKTTNGGNSWYDTGGWSIHVDQHAMAINPQNHNVVYLGNDGGFYSSPNGGETWSWNAQLPITQFYSCEVDEQHPERIYGGAQDNGVNRTTTGSLDDWEEIYGGDGLRVLVDPQDNKYVYAESQYGYLGRSTDGGSSFVSATSGISYSSRFNWNTPLAIDPQNPEVLYFGAQFLYKSINRAVSWNVISNDLTNGQQSGNLVYNTITTIAVSPLNSNLIYTGSDDGNVWYTADGGSSWNKISEDLPNRWVTSVVADPNVEYRVYVTFSGYRWDEYLPHIFKSDDFGTTWTDLSGNLPESPINDVVVDPVEAGYLYVGTDVGVYYSSDYGNNWFLAGNGMPVIVVNDLRLHNASRTLVAATYGRGIYTLDLDILTKTDNKKPTRNSNLQCYPNPFSDYLTINVKPTKGKTIVKVYNLAGEQVTELFVDGSSSSIIWDGTDNNKKHLPQGVYIVKLLQHETVSVAKVVLR